MKDENEMKKIIAAILTTALLAALFVLPAGAAFSDVPGSAWYAQDVAAMEKYGILQGTGSGKFSPNGTLTLAQAITIAARTYAYSNGETVPSSGSSVWYDDYLQYAAEKGICALGEFGTNYNNYCNRLTMASLFARVVPEGTDTPLNDVDSLPDVQNNEENQGVFLLYQLGVLTGSNQYGSFNPYQYVKRSETAAIVNRVLNPSIRRTFTLESLPSRNESNDPIQEAFGFSGNTVMLTVNGNNVTASDLMYWIAYNADYIEQYSAMDGKINWDDTLGGGQSVKDHVKEEAKQTAVRYSTVLANAAAAGYYFDSNDPQYIKELEAAKDNLGGEDAFARFLKEMCLTEQSFEKLNSVAVVYDRMREGLCRKPTAEELKQFIKDDALLAARHILLLTKAPNTGENFSKDVVVQKKIKAEELLARLQAIEDGTKRSEIFNQLMRENSEDSGLDYYPNGYLFTTGDMIAPFENATRALEIGGMSGIVESDYGYHIILRDDPAQSDELMEQWSSNKMESLTQEWVSSAEVRTTEAFENLDIADIYKKLTTYRETLQP